MPRKMRKRDADPGIVEDGVPEDPESGEDVGDEVSGEVKPVVAEEPLKAESVPTVVEESPKAEGIPLTVKESVKSTPVADAVESVAASGEYDGRYMVGSVPAVCALVAEEVLQAGIPVYQSEETATGLRMSFRFPKARGTYFEGAVTVRMAGGSVEKARCVVGVSAAGRMYCAALGRRYSIGSAEELRRCLKTILLWAGV